MENKDMIQRISLLSNLINAHKQQTTPKPNPISHQHIPYKPPIKNTSTSYKNNNVPYYQHKQHQQQQQPKKFTNSSYIVPRDIQHNLLTTNDKSSNNNITNVNNNNVNIKPIISSPSPSSLSPLPSTSSTPSSSSPSTSSPNTNKPVHNNQYAILKQRQMEQQKQLKEMKQKKLQQTTTRFKSNTTNQIALLRQRQLLQRQQLSLLKRTSPFKKSSSPLVIKTGKLQQPKTTTAAVTIKSNNNLLGQPFNSIYIKQGNSLIRKPLNDSYIIIGNKLIRQVNNQNNLNQQSQPILNNKNSSINQQQNNRKIVKRIPKSNVKLKSIKKQPYGSQNSNNQISIGEKIKKAIKKMGNKKQYCLFFNRFGKCNNGDKCHFLHDKSRVRICSKFLSGKCDDVDCTLQHKSVDELDLEQMPVCYQFLKGICTNEACPYLHVYVSKDADICSDFLKGYCPNGSNCKKKHTYSFSKNKQSKTTDTTSNNNNIDNEEEDDDDEEFDDFDLEYDL